MFHVKQVLGVFAIATISASASAFGGNPEKVEFPSLEESSPTTLTGYLYRPAKLDDKSPAPAVVLAHGCSGMIDESAFAKPGIKPGIKHWADRFVDKGYVVLAVDSFNPRGHAEVCTKANRPILESRERPRDAYGGLQYLAKQPFVAKDRVFLMGFSNGATGTLYAVEDDGKPHQLAKKAGVSFRAALAFYPGCTQANKSRLKTAIPLAIFIGADDDWTPAQPCQELVELNKSRGLEVSYFSYPGAYHGFDVPGSKVRVRTDVRMSNRPSLAAGVHVGGSEGARKAAEKDVDHYLRGFLAPSDAR